MDSKELITQLQWRYAVKKFDAAKKINSEDWSTIEQALVLSPSSYGLQPWKFLIVQDPEMRKKLTPVSWGQPQVEDCSHFVVLTAKQNLDETYIQKHIQRIADVRKVPLESVLPYKERIMKDLITGPRKSVREEWAARQVYIALGHLMACAALLQIDACPMEGIEPPQYDEILGLRGSGYGTSVACALGYRSTQDKYAQTAKVRFDKKDVIQVV